MESSRSLNASHYAGAKELLAFHNWYRNYHGYLASIVCLVGVVTNLLNIAVLTRRNMITATNCILTGLAISDALTMAAYLPFALRFYVLYGPETTPERNTLTAVRFLLFYACFSVVAHTVSIWMTVTLAIFRYIFIRHPRHAATLCSLERAKVAVFMVYITSLVVCIPNLATIGVQGESTTTSDYDDAAIDDDANNLTTITRGSAAIIWTVRFKQNSPADRFLYSFNFWIQALLVKLLPCIGLTILSILLVRTMRQVDAKRRNLMLAVDRQAVVTSRRHICRASRNRKTNRTTRMLLVVVALFLVTEFPQGVTNVLCGISRTFVEEVYLNLGDLIDILALTNNGINFILYCTMSKQFRDAFVQFFIHPIARPPNSLPVTQQRKTSTYI